MRPDIKTVCHDFVWWMGATPDEKWASHLVPRHSARCQHQSKWKWRHCIYRLIIIIITGLLSVTQDQRTCWRYRHCRNYCRPSAQEPGAFTELGGKSNGDRTGQNFKSGSCEIARSSSGSENIATVRDALTASPKRPYDKTAVRPGSWDQRLLHFATR